MYAVELTPQLLARLYRLRKEQGLGPIRRQVLEAVERYATEKEKEHGACRHPPGPPPGARPEPGRDH